MSEKATWIPPSLCGCQFSITAQWMDGSIIDHISYKHPIQYTIEDIQIINVCDQHKPQTLTMPDTSLFYSVPEPESFIGRLAQKYNHTFTPKQVRGYVAYPFDNPSPAHCLYAFFSLHKGQINHLECGCSTHLHFDENTTLTYLDHPRFSRKCIFHQNDSADMKMAKIDRDEIMKAMVSNDSQLLSEKV